MTYKMHIFKQAIDTIFAQREESKTKRLCFRVLRCHRGDSYHNGVSEIQICITDNKNNTLVEMDPVMLKEGDSFTIAELDKLFNIELNVN